MRLGTRWAFGSEPPASVPAALRPAITDVEARITEESRSSVRAHWTLTWLEGRPVAELDSGWEVVRTVSGEVVSRPFSA